MNAEQKEAANEVLKQLDAKAKLSVIMSNMEVVVHLVTHMQNALASTEISAADSAVLNERVQNFLNSIKHLTQVD